MRERPILFSGPMVLAVLERRKTQTRRVVKPLLGVNTHSPFKYHESNTWCWHTGKVAFVDDERHCPYGLPGDQLWVRETWYENVWPSYQSRVDPEGVPVIFYRADPLPDFEGEENGIRWRPSIHMPRWASRINLELLDVRVERLDVISEADAKAEGLKCLTKDNHRTYKYGIPDRDGLPGNDDYGWAWQEWEVDPRKAFAKAWDQINGKREGCAWADNPWVWVLDFKRIEVAP